MKKIFIILILITIHSYLVFCGQLTSVGTVDSNENTYIFLMFEKGSNKELHPIHEVQFINYLKATQIEVGLLINFSKSVDVRRKLLDKE